MNIRDKDNSRTILDKIKMQLQFDTKCEFELTKMGWYYFRYPKTDNNDKKNTYSSTMLIIT